MPVKKKKKKVVKKVRTSHGNCKFDEKLSPVIKNLMLKGYTDLEIAELIGVTEKTFYNWKKNYPDVFQFEGEWKSKQNELLERTLHKLASGYSLKETKVFLTKEGKIKTKEIIKHLPPNEKSIEFALCNRNPERWKNMSRIEHSMGDDMEKEFTLSYKQGDSKNKKKEK